MRRIVLFMLSSPSNFARVQAFSTNLFGHHYEDARVVPHHLKNTSIRTLQINQAHLDKDCRSHKHAGGRPLRIPSTITTQIVPNNCKQLHH